MTLTRKSVIGFAATAALGCLATNASAVILYASSQRNTQPPGSLINNGGNHNQHGNGDPRRLLNSGWQFQGRHGNFLGTPIAPQFYITAEHLGGPGGIFIYNGVTYTIDTSFGSGGFTDDGNSDLRIWKINETFPSFAPLFDEATGSEVGRDVVFFGRGTQRGAEVRVNGELKGWQWGTFDSVQSWGENNVTNLVNAGGGFGLLMSSTFDRDGGPNEAALSAGDSGGGMFIKSGATWKLAGINFAVDGPIRFELNGAPFDASIFDAGGLFVGSSQQFIPDDIVDVPLSSYTTLISSNLNWINGVIGSSQVPEPGAGLALLAAAPLLRRHRRV